MTDILDQLARDIYKAVVDLAVEGGVDSPYYTRAPMVNQGEPLAGDVETVAYDDLPQKSKDHFFELAQATLLPLREAMIKGE